jgi:hypothetical protein
MKRFYFISILVFLSMTDTVLANVPQDSIELKIQINKTNETKNTLDNVEQLSRIISIVAIPIVLGIIGWIVQRRLQGQTIKRDYVQLAVSILRETDQAKSVPELRSWSVDLLNESSPVKFDAIVSQKLKDGQVFLPSLEQFTAIPSPSLTPELIEKYRTKLLSFQSYLHEAGFVIESGEVKYEITDDSSAGYVALYDAEEKTMKILNKYANNTDLILHEYMHHVLNKSVPDVSVNKKWWAFWAIEYGLAVYFPCSYVNRSYFGDSRNYVYELNNDKVFNKEPFTENSYHHEGQLLWGGMFWSVRKHFGKDIADKIIAKSWNEWVPANSSADISEDFINQFIQIAKQEIGSQDEVIKEILRNRRLLD